MDVLLLGAAAIVLIALTLWIVWRPGDAVQVQEASDMLPQGDRFEDQYTSATADLSAAGVALTAAQDEEPAAPAEQLTDFQRSGEAWSEPSLARESAPLPMAAPDRPTLALPEPSNTSPMPKTIGIGAAALLALGGAVTGAWLYARWQKSRNQPLNRLRRTFR